MPPKDGSVGDASTWVSSLSNGMNGHSSVPSEERAPERALTAGQADPLPISPIEQIERPAYSLLEIRIPAHHRRVSPALA